MKMVKGGYNTLLIPVSRLLGDLEHYRAHHRSMSRRLEIYALKPTLEEYEQLQGVLVRGISIS